MILHMGLARRTEALFVSDTTYPEALTHGMYDHLFKSVEDLYKGSDLVAEVKITGQENVEGITVSSVETRSTAEIKQVLKGSDDLKSVVITESGGIGDMSKVATEKPGLDAQVPHSKIEITREGVPVMKKGHTYIVFLKKLKDQDGYIVSGSVQGKVRIDESTNKGAITASKENYDENSDLFLTQKKFTGKDKGEIVGYLKGIK